MAIFATEARPLQKIKTPTRQITYLCLVSPKFSNIMNIVHTSLYLVRARDNIKMEAVKSLFVDKFIKIYLRIYTLLVNLIWL